MVRLIHVLGLGESLEEFKPDGNTTIGVNDIHSRFNSDFVVCVDHPNAFSAERAKTILKTKCKGFYSQCKEWSSIPNFNLLNLSAKSNLDYLDSEDSVCYSNSSPFVAAVLAYKFGANEIVIHGADYRTHPNFKSHSLERVRLDFKELNKQLLKRGVKMYVGSDWSTLSEFLPVWK